MRWIDVAGRSIERVTSVRYTRVRHKLTHNFYLPTSIASLSPSKIDEKPLEPCSSTSTSRPISTGRLLLAFGVGIFYHLKTFKRTRSVSRGPLIVKWTSKYFSHCALIVRPTMSIKTSLILKFQCNIATHSYVKAVSPWNFGKKIFPKGWACFYSIIMIVPYDFLLEFHFNQSFFFPFSEFGIRRQFSFWKVNNWK